MFLTTASTPKIVKRRAVLATPHLPPTPPTTSFTMKSIIVLLVVWAVASAQGGTITDKTKNTLNHPTASAEDPDPNQEIKRLQTQGPRCQTTLGNDRIFLGLFSRPGSALTQDNFCQS